MNINVSKYANEVKRKLGIIISNEILEKDLLLTLILAEFQKENGAFHDLIFKGGTLLSRNFLRYHRFSEDLDFVHKESETLRKLPRRQRERGIKHHIDYIVPSLHKIAESLGLKFSTDRSDKKYCTILHGRTVYILRLYYNERDYVKVEINFIERLIHKPEVLQINTITDFFESKELMFSLGLRYENFRVLSYPLKEIVLEKYRAILTRNKFKERDLFDLFLIHGSLDAEISEIVIKIRDSSIIKRNLLHSIKEKLKMLRENKFFQSDENISDLAIISFDREEFKAFQENIKPRLIEICEQLLSRENGE